MIRLLPAFLLLLNIAPAAPVTLAEGDIVVFLGDTFLEREGTYGHIESALLAGHPGKTLHVRNLAWSGNTPNEQARSYFGPPAEGQQRLQGNLTLVKPNVIFCCYGAAVAAEGEAGLTSFIKDYAKLLDLIGTAEAQQVVLLSPPPVETKGQNEMMLVRQAQLAKVAAAVQALAAERKLNFIDLQAPLRSILDASPAHLTSNGVHFTAAGYAKIAPAVASALVVLAKSGQAGSEKLRTEIVAKNTLFFNRTRPQNEIYLFGSRKHEQGGNGVEIPQFDPLIQAKDQAIAALNQAAVP